MVVAKSREEKDAGRAKMDINKRLLEGSDKEIEVTFEGITAANLGQLQLIIKGENNQPNDQVEYNHEGIQPRSFLANVETQLLLKDLLSTGKLPQGKIAVKFNLQPAAATPSMGMTFKLIDTTEGNQVLQDIAVVWTKQAMKLQLSSSKQEIVEQEVLQVEIQHQENAGIHTDDIEMMLISSNEKVTFDGGQVKSMKNETRAVLSTMLGAPQVLNASGKLIIQLQLNKANNESLAKIYLQAYNKKDGQLIGNMQPVTWRSGHLQLEITPTTAVASGNQLVEVTIANMGQVIKTSDIEVTFQLPNFPTLPSTEHLFLIYTAQGVSKYVTQAHKTYTLQDLLGEEYMPAKTSKVIKISNLGKTNSKEVALTISAINKVDSNKEIGNSGPITWKNISLGFTSDKQTFSKELEVTVTNQGSEVNLDDIEVEMTLARESNVSGMKFNLGGASDVATGGKVTLAQILQSPKLQAKQQQTFKIRLADAGVAMSAAITLKATIPNGNALVGLLNNVQWKGIMLQASVQRPKLYGNQSTNITLTNTGLEPVDTKDLKIELIHGEQGIEYKLGNVDKIVYAAQTSLYPIGGQEIIQPGKSISFEMAVTDQKGGEGPIYFQLVIRKNNQVVVAKISFIIWQKTGIEVTADKDTIHGMEAATINIANVGDQLVDINNIGVRLVLTVPGMEIVTFRLGNYDFDFDPTSGIGGIISHPLLRVLPMSSSLIPINGSTSFQVKCTQAGSSLNRRDFTVVVYDSSTYFPIKTIPFVWER